MAAAEAKAELFKWLAVIVVIGGALFNALLTVCALTVLSIAR